MNADQDLDRLADHHGILGSFVDLSQQKRPTSPETKKALLRANGVELDNNAMIYEALAAVEAENAARRFPGELVVEAGAPFSLNLGNSDSWQLQLEGNHQGTVEGFGHTQLPCLPPGLHVLTVRSGVRIDQITLIATPRAAPSIEDLTGHSRLWGLNTALYGLRSARNLGIGDFCDLAHSGGLVAMFRKRADRRVDEKLALVFGVLVDFKVGQGASFARIECPN